LAQAARTTPLDVVRVAAIKRLTDQAVLADISKHDDDKHIRIAVVETLTDQVALAAIAF
jgi:hypothetical protein